MLGWMNESFVFSSTEEAGELFCFGLLYFLVGNFPVVVLIEESEDGAQIFRLFLQKL